MKRSSSGNSALLPAFVLYAVLFCVPVLCFAQEKNAAGNVILEQELGPFRLTLKERVLPEDGRGQSELIIYSEQTFQLSHFVLTDPLRVVVDIVAVVPPKGEIFPAEGSQAVKRIRVGVHPDKTRIVMDIRGSVSPDINVLSEGNTATIVMTMLGAFAPLPTPTHPEPTVAPTPESEAIAMPEAVSSPEVHETPPPAVRAPAVQETPAEAPPVTREWTPIAEMRTGRIYPTSLPTDTPAPLPTSTPTGTPTLTPEVVYVNPEAEEQAVILTPPPEPTAVLEVLPEKELKEVREEPTLPVEEATSTPAAFQETSTPAPPRPQMEVNIPVIDSKKHTDVAIPAQKLQELARINFSVDKLLLVFRPGDRLIEDVLVKNPGKKEIYVSAVPQSVANPGTREAARTETQDLLVSPRRFKIEPESERAVRVVLKGLPQEVEKVYEIAFSVNKDSFEAEYVDVMMDGKPTRLRVVTNLIILNLAEPPSPKVLLGAERREGEVVLVNRGNVSVLLGNGKVCRGEKNENCIVVPPRRLYPGNIMRLKLPDDWSLFFIKDSVAGFEQFYLPPAGAE